jgi:DNA-binding protein Fis
MSDASRAKYEEQLRQQRIDLGTREIRELFADKFNSDYYQGIEKTARDLYEPQINDQYKLALNSLEAALSRSGLSSSTAGNQKRAEALEQKESATTKKRAMIQSILNQRKQGVMDAENSALAQLQDSANPFAAAQSASQLIKQQSQPEVYQPLGQIFTDFTAGLATQAELEREGNNRYDFGVTNWFKPKRSVLNVGG